MAVQKIDANDRSLAVNQSTNAMSRKEAGRNQKNSEQMKNGSININALGGKMDSILARKQRAQKKAMKVVGDAWAADKKFDLDLQERRNHLQELKNSLTESREQLDNCNAGMAEIKELYGIEEGSQEQKDVELVQLWKKNSAAGNMSLALSEMDETRDPKETWEELTHISLTDEDWQRMVELRGKIASPTEYQKRALEIADEADFFQKNIKDLQIDIEAEDMSIRSIKIERLKDHTMTDAQEEAEEIMKDAGKEIIGMLIGEAQDNIDEKLEEKVEDAKEKEKEKEEQEEKLEKQRLEKEVQQVQLEIEQEESKEAEDIKNEQRRNARKQAELLDEVQDNTITPFTNTAEAQAQIRAMLQRMKILEEDLKGVNVDKKLKG